MNPTTLDLTAKRHFTLPAAIVLSLSAALFFGFGRNPPVMRPYQPHHRVIDPSAFPVLLSDEVPAEKSDTQAVNGGQSRAQLPDVVNPVSSEQPDRLEVPLPPVTVNGPAQTPLIGPWSPGDPTKPIGDTGSTVLDSRSLDHSPQAVVQPAPIYPDEAKRDGLHGKVVVEFLVDEAGRVFDPRVVSSSDGIFEEPTLRTVEKWRFAPGTRHGAPVRFRMSVPVTFELDEWAAGEQAASFNSPLVARPVAGRAGAARAQRVLSG
jgi:periplasmic protein TonB